MNEVSLGVFGASGYVGMELTRLLARHPRARLAFVAGERWVGSSVRQVLGEEGPAGELLYTAPEAAVAEAGRCAVALLATPPEVSLALAPRLLERGCRVIDLSGAFRLSDGREFERYYHHPAPPPALLAQAVYGLPELNRAALAEARLVANPGCYPTAAILALGPLLREGFLETGSLIVDAASGVTGAGRRASEEYSFVELEGDFRTYKVLRHQHTPEISQLLGRFAGAPVELTFTAHLLPIRRGILATSYARLRRGATAAELTLALRAAYRDEPFVTVAPAPERVSLLRVVGTNHCLLGVACEPAAGGRVVLVSAIDNLLKGAAGQAVQNLNLMLGWEETSGLNSLRSFYP
jgi:N-acetyl-gamma-glutamyl-phosphate reductase